MYEDSRVQYEYKSMKCLIPSLCNPYIIPDSGDTYIAIKSAYKSFILLILKHDVRIRQYCKSRGVFRA